MGSNVLIRVGVSYKFHTRRISHKYQKDRVKQMKPIGLHTSNFAKAVTFAILATVVTVPALTAVQPALAAPNFPDPAMAAVWNRTDKPVADQVVSRSWMWGPEVFYVGSEPYIEGQNGQHLVAYLDKSRMEINNPNGDRNNPFFVTNGLLVVEMMTGRIQTGNNAFLQGLPADIPVAGDTATSVNAPTYTSLASVASLNGNNRAPDRTGQQVSEGLQRTGGVGVVNNLAGYAKYAVYDNTLGHNIPDVFWNFMNQSGPVYVDGQYQQDTVIDWVFAMGYPLTEAYWIPIQVGNQQKWVLMQAFQRRILTYTPGNPAGFEVEMGNVGRTYYDWRYGGQTPGITPTPTPQPTPPVGQAAITVSPSQGDATTTLQVQGVNFPRNTAVTIQVERTDANYAASVTTVTADGNGVFTSNFRLPAQATQYDSVTIAAIANNGSVRATAGFNLSYSPKIDVSPKVAIIKGGPVDVTGSGFPADISVQVGILFDGSSNAEYPATTSTDDDGTFHATFGIGNNRAAGSRFIVFATAAGGLKASYNNRITVYNQPLLQVSPSSGPINASVTLQGAGWPAGQSITIGYKGIHDQSEAFLPTQVSTTANGTFSVPVFIDSSFRGKSQVLFIASLGGTGLSAQAIYNIAGAPPPVQPVVTVSPSALQVGQQATVNGSAWTPGSQVTISLVIPGKQQDVATAGVTGNGTFAAGFTLGQDWANLGVVQLVARSSDGRTASTNLTVIPSGGTSTLEYGLNMQVQSYSGVGGPYVKLTGQGWQPGLTLIISVVSVNGDVNYGVANAVVKNDGTWQASFDNIGPWVGRADIGVRSSDPTGQFVSGRRLPVSNLTQVSGGNYTVTGSNWGPASKVTAALLVDGVEQQSLGSATADINGSFAFQIVVPRANGSRSIRITSSGTAIQYEAVFGLDARGDASVGQPVMSFVPPAEGTTLAEPSFKAAPVVGMPRTGGGDQATTWWLVAGASALLVLAGLVLVRRRRSISR